MIGFAPSRTTTAPVGTAPDARTLHPCTLALFALSIVAAIGISLLWTHGPGTVALHLPGGFFTIHHAAAKLAAALLTPAVVLPFVLAVEAWITGWNHSSARDVLRGHSASAASDLMLFLITRSPAWNIARVALTFGLAYLSAEDARRWLAAHAHFDLSIAELPTPLIWVVLLLSHTFLNYWNHRLEHTRLFWPHHRFHHAATQFTVFTGDRFHPGDVPTLFLAGFAVTLLNAPPTMWLAYGAVQSGVRYAIHSRMDTDWGWIGRYIVLSPNHHRAHHLLKAGPGEIGNYGLIPLWDALFGTLSAPAPTSAVIGTATPYRQGWCVLPDLLRDTLDFLRGAVRFGGGD